MFRRLIPTKYRRRLRCRQLGHQWVVGHKHSDAEDAGLPPTRFCVRCGRLDHSSVAERVPVA